MKLEISAVILSFSKSWIYLYDAGAICLALSNLGGYPEHLSSAIRSLNKAAQGDPPEISVAGILLAQAEISKPNTRNRNVQKWEQVLRLSWKSWPEGALS